MDIFIYSDESGVLDQKHNEYYVFGGLVFLSAADRDNCSRKYTAAEENIRISESMSDYAEVKACNIKPKSKNKLYRIVNDTERFGIVISQKQLNPSLFSNKKTKQRYLDWAYKMSIKKKFEKMIACEKLNPSEIANISFYVDEHSTATDGLYELRESLEKELKIGMWNFNTMTFHPPLFPNIRSLNLHLNP